MWANECILFVVNTIEKRYQIKFHVFPVILMYKNRVHRSKHLGLFQSANPPAQVGGLGGAPFALPESHVFEEISFFRKFGQVCFLLGECKGFLPSGETMDQFENLGAGGGLIAPNMGLLPPDCPIKTRKILPGQ